MGWTKTTHEGRVMWERGGERVFEPPTDTPRRSSGPEPVELSAVGALALISFFLGLLVGLLIGGVGS